MYQAVCRRLVRQTQGRSHPKVRLLHHVPRNRSDDLLSFSTSSAVRNEVGVQLLSRRLHEQIFKNISFPPPDPRYVTIAQQHLKKHGLDIRQGSRLPDISFDLPPLQGRTLDEHFWNIGAQGAQPWLGKAKAFAEAQIPPQPNPEQWDITTSGWTKYEPGGISYPVPYPDESEDMLVFDVETLPNYSPFAIMATAASPTAWYAWISPWLLDQSSTPKHLIPFGPSHQSGSERVVVGHNVSYDRARIREEYHIQRTKTRFVDTMALHVAVKGISSGQRPSWIKYTKAKKEKAEQEKREDREELEVLLKMVEDAGSKLAGETDEENIKRLEGEIDNLLKAIRAQEKQDAEDAARISADLEGMAENAGAGDGGGGAEKRWEDLTSANSLADVAKLHCGIEIDKTVRNDLMTHSPSQILDDIRTYLSYCATDVSTTHAVFTRVLPAFLTACPNPVSFAGVLTMGSSFLSVNGAWKDYLKAAEDKFRELEESVKDKLRELAEAAKQKMEDESWRDDVWLSQLDWSEKAPGKSRGVEKIVASSKGKKVSPRTKRLFFVLKSLSLANKQPLGFKNYHSTMVSRIAEERSVHYDTHAKDHSPSPQSTIRRESHHLLFRARLALPRHAYFSTRYRPHSSRTPPHEI